MNRFARLTFYEISSTTFFVIVMSTQGGSTSKRFSLGSVTEKMVREAPEGMLVLKAEGPALVG